MTLRTVIVEDEQPSLDRLKDLLSAFPEIELVGTARDGQEAVECIDSLQPDLAFLDIQLPVFTSFEVLNQIHHRPKIIFMTAYDQYAINAFEENAIDYLLKPTTPERLAKAINRVKQANQPLAENVLELLKTKLQPPSYSTRFTVKVGEEILFIPAEDVFWFHAADKYVFLNTYNRDYILDLTLKKLEARLDPANFLRIHKSLIISTDKIHRIRRSFSGKYKVQLSDAKNSSFEIGRTFLSGVRERLGF